MTSFRNTGDTLRIHTQPRFGKFRSVKRNKRRFDEIRRSLQLRTLLKQVVVNGT